MAFDTKIAIAVADDLPVWQKLNVVAFLTSGIIGGDEEILGEVYRDAAGQIYLPLCVQPVVVLKASREKLGTYLQRAHSRGVQAAITIEDMFATGHDAANRQTVLRYETGDLPLAGPVELTTRPGRQAAENRVGRKNAGIFHNRLLDRDRYRNRHPRSLPAGGADGR